MRPRSEESGLEELLVGYGGTVAIRGDEWQGKFNGVIVVDGVACDCRWDCVVTLVHDANYGDTGTFGNAMSMLEITV